MSALTERKSKLMGYKPCLDIFNKHQPHGDYFTPPSLACNYCLCEDGRSSNCVAVQCQQPKCKNFKRVPGKCCDYTCPSGSITDTKTLAVVVTLSAMLLVIMIAIVIVWVKMRRRRMYGKRLETISTSSAHQETDIDSEIKRNSVPNNIRQQMISPHPLASLHSTPSCSGVNSTHDEAEEGHDDVKEQTVACVSSSGTHELKTALLNQHEVVACCSSDRYCTHTTRRFEPPPPYSPPKNLAFV